MSQYRPFMTDAMLEVYDGFKEEMEKECLFCLGRLKQANIAGNISLPHENERGIRVIQGARIDMHQISDYWYGRLQYAARFVSREFQVKHELYNKNIGIEKQ